MDKLRESYKAFLQGLNKTDLNLFLDNIKNFKKDDLNYFKLIEEYLNKEIPGEFLGVFCEEEFIKAFYLDSQAEYIKNKFSLSQDLDIFKTLVYCYNTNEREFNDKEDAANLKNSLLSRGFKEQELYIKEGEGFKDLTDDLKKLEGLKVICVMDVSAIGLMGSFDKKEEIEGTLKYSDYHKTLMLIPKRSRTRGFLIRKKFYYKEVTK
jgi:hypothetical protein